MKGDLTCSQSQLDSTGLRWEWKSRWGILTIRPNIVLGFGHVEVLAQQMNRKRTWLRKDRVGEVAMKGDISHVNRVGAFLIYSRLLQV